MSMSRYVRSATETRALKMLRTLATSAVIRSQMEAHGYTQADQDEGWSLCLSVAGYGAVGAAPVTNQDSIRAAFAQLTDFVSDELPCLAGGVQRKHPELYEVLFGGLTLGSGADAVMETTLFLDRFDALSAKGAKKAEHAVADLLARRGFTAATAAGLRKTLHTTRAVPEVAAPAVDDPKAKRDAEIERLRAWVEDWSRVARRAMKRKDELHRLGIGRRGKSGGAVDDGGAGVVPVVVTPVGGDASGTAGSGSGVPALPAGNVPALPAAGGTQRAA